MRLRYGFMVILLVLALESFSTAAETLPSRLFPEKLPASQWSQFNAAGYSIPVTGVIYSDPGTVRPVSGMPLGGLDTGCIDLEPSGNLGYNSIFNSLTPRGGPLNIPILGLSVGGKTWVMTTGKTKPFGVLRVGMGAQNEVARVGKVVADSTPDLVLDGVEKAKSVRYWGHYPVADVEFETDAPVSVALRAWSPFIPGDEVKSMIPGAVFEVHLRNDSNAVSEGSLVFSFPGPDKSEVDANTFERKESNGDFCGIEVATPRSSYALGVIGGQPVRIGGDLGVDGAAWAGIAKQLPQVIPSNPGSSVAIDFSLEPGQVKIVRYVLTWYSPNWVSCGNWSNIRGSNATNTFTHMYAKYYPNALSTARLLAREHQSLLRRIIAWQEVIYSEKTLPDWLRDQLINNLHLITEVGAWAQAKPPVGDWAKPEEGIFEQNESPRSCSDMECTPCTYYSGMAIHYLFPNLLRSTLRAQMALTPADGTVPLVMGGIGWEMITPFFPDRQRGQNGSWLIGTANRYWKITGDDKFLKELYPFLKKVTIRTFTMNPDMPYGLIVLPEFDQEEAFEYRPFKGMSSHVAIIRLYHLRTMEAIAHHQGDAAFVKQCREWRETIENLLEEHLWTGRYYMQQNDLKTGIKEDVLMGYVFDGEFMAWHDGTSDGVLPRERVMASLKTIKEAGIAAWGPRVWSDPNGGPVKGIDVGYWTPDGVHAPSALMLAATYMYRGDKEFGVELARKIMENMVCRNGWMWDMPILYSGANGSGIYGNDYGQMMAVWKLPAAVQGKTVAEMVKPGGFIARVIQAAKPR